MTWSSESEPKPKPKDKEEYAAMLLEIWEEEREFNRDKLREHGYRIGVLY